jgi:hypothetical protein
VSVIYFPDENTHLTLVSDFDHLAVTPHIYID